MWLAQGSIGHSRNPPRGPTSPPSPAGTSGAFLARRVHRSSHQPGTSQPWWAQGRSSGQAEVTDGRAARAAAGHGRGRRSPWPPAGRRSAFPRHPISWDTRTWVPPLAPLLEANMPKTPRSENDGRTVTSDELEQVEPSQHVGQAPRRLRTRSVAPAQQLGPLGEAVRVGRLQRGASRAGPTTPTPSPTPRSTRRCSPASPSGRSPTTSRPSSASSIRSRRSSATASAAS